MMTFKEETGKPSLISRLYKYKFYNFNNDKTDERAMLLFRDFPINHFRDDICGIIVNCRICFYDCETKQLDIEKQYPGFNYDQVEVLINSNVLKQISEILKNNNVIKTVNIKKFLTHRQVSHVNKLLCEYTLTLPQNELMDKFTLYNIYNLKLPDDITDRHDMAGLIDQTLEMRRDNSFNFFYKSDVM